MSPDRYLKLTAWATGRLILWPASDVGCLEVLHNDQARAEHGPAADLPVLLPATVLTAKYTTRERWVRETPRQILDLIRGVAVTAERDPADDARLMQAAAAIGQQLGAHGFRIVGVAGADGDAAPVPELKPGADPRQPAGVLPDDPDTTYYTCETHEYLGVLPCPRQHYTDGAP